MGRILKEDRRRYTRVSVDFPVVYRIKTRNVLGRAMNACNEGMMIDAYLSLETAAQLLQSLAKNRRYKLPVRFTYKNKAYRSEAEIRHFHLDFLGNERCRNLAGFFIPKMA